MGLGRRFSRQLVSARVIALGVVQVRDKSIRFGHGALVSERGAYCQRLIVEFVSARKVALFSENLPHAKRGGSTVLFFAGLRAEFNRFLNAGLCSVDIA